MTQFFVNEIAPGRGAFLRDISADGRVVSFVSFVDGGGGIMSRLSVLELATGIIRVIAEAPRTTTPSGAFTGIEGGALSGNGRLVFYTSGVEGGFLSAGVPTRLFRADTLTGFAQDITPGLTQPIGLVALELSDDGSRVFYNSKSSVGAGIRDRVEVADLATVLTTFLYEIVQPSPFGEGGGVDLSADGRFALYQEQVAFGANPTIRHELATGIKTVVLSTNVGVGVPQEGLSDNGRFALVNRAPGVGPVVRDIDLGADRAVAVTQAGFAADGTSRGYALSGDARYVAFLSTATNLIAGDTDGTVALLVKDLANGLLVRVADGFPSVLGLETAAFSTDGSRLAFRSTMGGSFVVSFAAPTIATALVAGDDQVNGAEKPGLLSISGTSDAIGATVQLSVAGFPNFGTARVGADASWAVPFASFAVFPDGVVELVASVTIFGRTTSATRSITIDSSAFITIDPVGDDGLVNTAEELSLIRIGGSSDARGQPLQIWLDGVAIGPVTVATGGNWQALIDARALSEGTHRVQATTTDAAGNFARSETSFSIDRSPPSVSILTAGDSFVLPQGGGNFIVTGTADEVGGTVALFLGNTLVGSAVVGADGNWSGTATRGYAGGAVELRAVLADAAGNFVQDSEQLYGDLAFRRVSEGSAGEQGGSRFSASLGGGSVGFADLSFDGSRLAFTGFFLGLGPDAEPAVFTDEAYLGRGFVKELVSGALTPVVPGSATGSIIPVLSASGAHVVFTTREPLSPSDSPAGPGPFTGLDVYVQDVATGQNRLVSTRADGSAAGNSAATVLFAGFINPESTHAVSDDGRIVAYIGLADRVAPAGFTWELPQIIVRDMAETTGRVVVPLGLVGEVRSQQLQLSADGAVVVFAGTTFYDDSFISPPPPRRTQDLIFGGDWRSGDIRLLSSREDGTAVQGYAPSLSADGRFMAFGGNTVWVKDLLTGALVDAMTDQAGNGPIGSEISRLAPSISADGRYVAFTTAREFGGDDPAGLDSFVKDLQTGALTRLNLRAGQDVSFGTTLSGNGEVVVFSSRAAIDPDDSNANFDLYAAPARPAAIAIADGLRGEAGPVTARGTAPGGATVQLFLDGVAAGSAVADGAGGWSAVVDAGNAAAGTRALRATVTDALGFTSSDGAALIITGAGAGNDEIWGSGAAELLRGLAGDDVLRGLGGADTMAGGPGNDVYVVQDVGAVVTEAPGEGTDTVFVGIDGWTAFPGIETLRLFGGARQLTGGDGAETIVADPTLATTLDGGAGDDVLWGSTQADLLRGGAGQDTLRGQGGADRLEGGPGDDVFVVEDAAAVVIELPGGGTDTVHVSADGWTATTNVEFIRLAGGATRLTGSADGDVITGNPALGSALDGMAGDDALWGSVFADTLTGGTGDDVLRGQGGADRFVYGTAGWGTDRITGFTAGEARLDFRGSGLAFDALTIAAGNGYVEVSQGGAAIIVFGVATLTQADFLF